MSFSTSKTVIPRAHSLNSHLAALSSYDLVKTFAVLIMFIDHISLYFFSTEMWWRAVGRIGFFIWFFLVGYSQNRKIPTKLVVAAAFLVLCSGFISQQLTPLNTLCAIILIRLTLDDLMQFCLRGSCYFIGALMLMMVINLPLALIIEYGSLGYIAAMLGYLVQRKDQFDECFLVAFTGFALASFLFYQQFLFGFSLTQFLTVGSGTALVCWLLLSFQPQSYPELTAILPRIAVQALQFSGRRTMEIYVVHLVLLKLIGSLYPMI